MIHLLLAPLRHNLLPTLLKVGIKNKLLYSAAASTVILSSLFSTVGASVDVWPPLNVPPWNPASQLHGGVSAPVEVREKKSFRKGFV